MVISEGAGIKTNKNCAKILDGFHVYTGQLNYISPILSILVCRVVMIEYQTKENYS